MDNCYLVRFVMQHGTLLLILSNIVFIAKRCNNETIVQELTYSAMCRAGAIGVTRVDMASPRFASFRNKIGQAYIGQFNIVVVSAVVALDVILTDTKREGVIFWTHSQTQTEGV